MSAALATLAIDAVEAAPAVIAGIKSLAGGVETDVAGHKTVANITTDAIDALQTSLKSPAIEGAIGANGTAVVTDGVNLVDEAEQLWDDLEAAGRKVAAFFGKL